MPRVTLPYREFYYPLNVFMHILTHEEPDVPYLHYGLFASPDESLTAAQEHSTALLLASLPPPPCRILEVGIGLATTLKRLLDLGYDAEGITPDEKQIAMARSRHGDGIPVHRAEFESWEPGRTYDVIVFQESSQYIDSEPLFARASGLAPRLVVLDEFATRRLDPPGRMHRLDIFLRAAARHRFTVVEHTDLSARALPTIPWFLDRIPRYRERIVADLGLREDQVDELIEGGHEYVALYEAGDYAYRLIRLEREGSHFRT